MIEDLSFTCIAVNHLDRAIASYQEMFGMQVVQRGTTDSLHVEYAYLSLGNTCLELITPLPGNEYVAKYLEPYGDRAYIIGLEVGDMDAALTHLKAEGVTPYRSATLPDGMRLEWIRAEDTHGIIVQLLQAAPGQAAMPAIPPNSSGSVERLSLHCIIVKDLEGATADWKRLFGVEVRGHSEGEELGNRNNVLPLGDKGALLEIMTPRTGDEPWAKLLRERGETTFLLGFDVADMDGVVAHIRSTGRRVVGEHTGADGSKMAMGHPLGSHGGMIEVLQAAPGVGH